MYVEDNSAEILCYVADKETGQRIGEVFPMGSEPEIDEETQEIVGVTNWHNLTHSYGRLVKYAAFEMNQNTLSLIFIGFVDQPDPSELAAPYQKVKLNFGEMTDKQMLNALKVSCAGCNRQEKGGKRGVTVNVYRAGAYCPDCAATLGLGKPTTVSRYTREGYMKHASEKGNQAVLFSDGEVYDYQYRDNRNNIASYLAGGRRYEMVKVGQVAEDAA